MVRHGTKDRQIVALLGRPMTTEEKTIVDRARAVAMIERAARKAELARHPAMDSAGRNRKLRDAAHILTWPDLTPDEEEERAALEADTATWLRHYFPGIYRQPFGSVHHEIIEAAEYTIDHGGRCVVAAPRGTGKSFVLAGVALKAMLQGRVRFPVVIPWDSKALKKTLSFWKKALCYNEDLDRLYPEFCRPFRAGRGMAQRVSQFTDAAGVGLGAQMLISEGMIVLPCSRGVIGGSTINGNPLGLHHTTDAGEGLRPDLIFIDDPQDRETALSPYQIKSTIEMIDFDIAGMGGPDMAMPIMAACTVKQPRDVAEHYLDGGAWRAVRVPQITAWPDGFEAGGLSRKRWDEWNEIRKEGEHGKDGGAGERAYYLAHWADMVAGMAVSWDHRYIDQATKDQPAQPDALYAAMSDYYTMGASVFLAERQQQPVDERQELVPYQLTPEAVSAKTDPKRARGVVPEFSKLTVAATDINISYALTNTITAFRDYQVAAVCHYWMETNNGAGFWHTADGDGVRRAALWPALETVGKNLAAMTTCKPDIWVIDCAGTDFPTVVEFAREAPQRYGIRTVMGVRGMADNKQSGYRVNRMSIRIGEYCHEAVYDLVRPAQHWIAFHKSYWEENAQKGWLAPDGAPGSISLPAGSHREFAEQVCGERLLAKAESAVGRGVEWKWSEPGRHDYGDCIYMSYAAAAFMGIGTAGVRSAVKPTRKRYSQKDLMR